MGLQKRYIERGKEPGPDFIDKEPSNYEEVAEKKKWKNFIIKEYQSIMKNDVWDVVPRPEGKSVVTSKWIYKIKHDAYGSIEKYKERFVAHGFSQKEEIDYEETFAPVSRYTSIISVLCNVPDPLTGEEDATKPSNRPGN